MKDIDVTERDRRTVRIFGRAALLTLAIVVLLALFGAVARPSPTRSVGAELTGELRTGRNSPEGPAPGWTVVHGDFDWINRGKYRSQSGELCCGIDDCYVVEPGRIHQGPQGYELLDHAGPNGSAITVPYRSAIPSEDGKYWICKVGARMRCFFAPLNGF